MYSDACLGTFTTAADFWEKVKLLVGEEQNADLC